MFRPTVWKILNFWNLKISLGKSFLTSKSTCKKYGQYLVDRALYCHNRTFLASCGSSWVFEEKQIRKNQKVIGKFSIFLGKKTSLGNVFVAKKKKQLFSNIFADYKPNFVTSWKFQNSTDRLQGVALQSLTHRFRRQGLNFSAHFKTIM